jgi:hypothetical protein
LTTLWTDVVFEKCNFLLNILYTLQGADDHVVDPVPVGRIGQIPAKFKLVLEMLNHIEVIITYMIEISVLR